MALRLVSGPRGPSRQHHRAADSGLACVRLGDRGRPPSYGELQRSIQAAARVRASMVLIDLRELSSIGATTRRLIAAAVRGIPLGTGRVVLLRKRTQAEAFGRLDDRGRGLDIVELDPAEPPVQALLRLARRERAPAGSS